MTPDARPTPSLRGTPKEQDPPRTEVDDLREWKRRLSLLLDYARQMSIRKELDPLLGTVVNAAREILQAERCTVFLLDKKKNELWARVATGDHDIRVPADKGIVGQTIMERRVINIADAYADDRFNPEVDRASGFRTRSILTAPLAKMRGEVLGALQVLNKKGGPFQENDEKMFILFAEQAASALANAQLYEELQAAYKDTIFRLAAAAEFKDHDTRNHLERVSRYSRLIAAAVGMEKEWCDRLALASPMHDIGKLGVPDAVLKKPGKLDEEEWKEMHRHPNHGAEILANSDNELLQMSERIARSHHEKWDGTGYPTGLKGDAIPLEARIVAVADVFDALTSRRCYKPAFSLDNALKIIYEGSGKHFDPALVYAFKQVLDSIVQVMEKFTDRPEIPPLT
ncbi:MAG: HD domain-containing protein [Elusimicrobia bacterium]|jgi:HD-GYP domain-containing protein (c-di-GMP phosphodiesterase class II)|nr:HD domain-containing protein [Elusimicrobiota bacterium]